MSTATPYAPRGACPNCKTREAFEEILRGYQRLIDGKRAELAALESGADLAYSDNQRVAFVEVLRQHRPFVATFEGLQMRLHGEVSEAAYDRLKNLVSRVRREPDRYLEPGEWIRTVPRVGYQLAKDRPELDGTGR